ncbi:type III effector [Marinomonas mediterranea]|uniref:type III effector n=1 Tax=Marinomonas mediterranea TaxID=119864 RepID=UPI00234983AE|nr:type III effector [Marinomonas mediterranea]WCN11909.1 type III effector [Marinomonas mediterranea]
MVNISTSHSQPMAQLSPLSQVKSDNEAVSKSQISSKNQTNTLQKNEKIEAVLGDYIANHPAAKATMNALVNGAVKTFTKAHGELKGWAEVMQAAARPGDSNRNGNGVLSARFDVIGSVGWNGPAIKSTLKSGSLREQGTLFLNLILSKNFQSLLKNSASNESLKPALAETFNTKLAHEKQDSLFKMTGWAAQTNHSREQVAKAHLAPAGALISEGKISQRELAFHRHNAVNQSGNQDKVGFNIPPPSTDELKVLRGYGKDIWKIKPDSDFAQKADQHQKPVIAGPSGSAARFMAVAKLLEPHCQAQLGVSDERSLTELTRFACYAYFLQDSHHSMLEINLGAAEQGLDEQWDDSLYNEMFSQPIQGKGFEVNTDMLSAVVNDLNKGDRQ